MNRKRCNREALADVAGRRAITQRRNRVGCSDATRKRRSTDSKRISKTLLRVRLSSLHTSMHGQLGSALTCRAAVAARAGVTVTSQRSHRTRNQPLSMVGPVVSRERARLMHAGAVTSEGCRCATGERVVTRLVDRVTAKHCTCGVQDPRGKAQPCTESYPAQHWTAQL
jgi:hypothetical protein